MKNYVQEGETLTLTAPVGGCVSGSAYKIGRFFGVAQGDADAGDPVDLALVGVFDLAKAGEAVAEGDPAYWDTVALALTKTAGATASTLVGAFAAAALIGDATAPVRLSGGSVDDSVAEVAAAVSATNGGAGNAAKLLKLDANGKAAGRVLETDGAALDLLLGATAAGAVIGSDYAAQSVLLAVADDTPLPVTIAAKTVIGRGGTGDAGAIAASVTLDAAGPAIDDATETTAPAGGILGRNVFGSVECVSEVANSAGFEAKVETAPASGVFKSVNVISHPAGIAATFRDSFAFWVPPGCKYKFAKTVAGGATVAFTGDGYNYADL